MIQFLDVNGRRIKFRSKYAPIQQLCSRLFYGFKSGSGKINGHYSDPLFYFVNSFFLSYSLLIESKTN